MDLKMGTVTVERQESHFKKAKLMLRDVLVGARFNGVQLVAMSVQYASNGSKVKADKLAVGCWHTHTRTTRSSREHLLHRTTKRRH